MSNKNNGAIVLPEDKFVSGAVPGTGTGTGAGTGTGTGNNLKAYGNYKDWYRGVTGKEYNGSGLPTDVEGIDSYTMRQGMALYNYDQDVAAANSAHQYTERQAAKARDSEMEYSGVLFERMKKYMPMQQKAAGMGNMGIAQTGLNEITNTHMNRRAAITGEYNDTMAEAGRLQQQSIAEAGKLSRQEIIDIYTDKEAADKAAADKAETDAEAKRQTAIQAFSASISSYDNAESAKAGLDALGLAADDPQYTALLTQIEGYFRDKAEDDTQALVGKVMENLRNGVYDDREKAIWALKSAGGLDLSSYATNLAEIEGYFRDKTKKETKEEDDKEKAALDEQYLWLEELLMNADTSQVEQIWAANAEDIAKMTPEQKARLNTLRSLAASAEQEISSEEQTKLENNYNDMLIEVQSLMESYASDEDIKAALDYWGSENRTDPERYQRYYDQVMKTIKTPQFDTAQLQAKNDTDEALRNYQLAQEAATAENGKYGNDVEGYVKDVLDGKTPLKGDGGLEYEIKKKAIDGENKLFESEEFQDAMKKKFGTTKPTQDQLKNGTALSFKIEPNEDGQFNWRDIARWYAAGVATLAGAINPFIAIAKSGMGFATGHGANQLLEYEMTVVYFNGEWYPAKVKK